MMTRNEIDSFAKTVVERQAAMEGLEVPLRCQMVGLEKDIAEIERQLDVLKDKVLTLHDSFNLSVLPVGGNVLWNEYMKSGFGSDVVKDCVGVVRKLFFNDSDPDFRRLDCIFISDYYRGGHNGIVFAFYDGKQTVRINLVSVKTPERPHTYGSPPRGDWIGEMSLSKCTLSDLVRNDLYGSITVECSSDNNFITDRILMPTRDIHVVREFVHDVVKGKDA